MLTTSRAGDAARQWYTRCQPPGVQHL